MDRGHHFIDRAHRTSRKQRIERRKLVAPSILRCGMSIGGQAS